MSGSSKILVIEDDPSIRLGLEDTLSAKGYEVTVRATGKEGLAVAESWRPDLIILDIMLPDTTGFDVCRQLKSSKTMLSETPVIILSARGAELDRVRGLELGADDYVTKPFSLMELLARVSVVLRRSTRSAPADSESLEFGDVTVNFRKQRAEKSGTPVDVSNRGFQILRVLALHRGEVVSRETLLEEAWGYEGAVNTRTVDNHVVKLRKLIEDEPDKPIYLVTVHGAGYRLVE